MGCWEAVFSKCHGERHSAVGIEWQDEDWQRVNQAVCRGDRGTLIKWVNTGKAMGEG